MRSVRNCNVAVIGGAGFLGSHLVNHLIEDRKCNVLVIDNLCAGRREWIHPQATFVHHDITGSEEYLNHIFRGGNFLPVKYGNQIDYVFNYAAYPYVPDSYDRPLHVCNVNFFGAMKVINAAQEAGVKGILQVSSAEVYGSGNPLEYQKMSDPEEAIVCSELTRSKALNEYAPVTPHSSYGASKAAIDAWCQVRWKEAQTPVIALRQFNCVGERESHPYVIPEIISQLSKLIGDAICTKCYTVRNMADPPCSRCNGTDIDPNYIATVYLGNNSSRDFMYAGDAVKISVDLLEKGQFGEVYNLGSEESIKIYDLAQQIARLMGFERCEVVQDKERCRPWEIWYLQSDNSKIENAIYGDGRKLWQHPPIEDALKLTIKWYQDNGNKWPWEK